MRNMKKILLFPLFFAVFAIVGCDVKSAMDEDLYPQKVYITADRDGRFIDRSLDLGKTVDTITVAVAVSGSRPSTQDVTVTVKEIPSAVDAWCARELSPTAVQWRSLAPEIHSFPTDRVTINAGAVYNTYPIFIEPSTLHMDSLYMMALQLTSTSAYELNTTDTLAYMRLNLINQYSGQYYMDGQLTEVGNETNFLSYVKPRMLSATNDGNTVRMYHFENETYSGAYGGNTDYRTNVTFKISVNPNDKSLTLTTWDRFQLIEGGGTYVEEWNLYDIWYTYTNTSDGKTWKCEGYLYKQPEGGDQDGQLRYG